MRFYLNDWGGEPDYFGTFLMYLVIFIMCLLGVFGYKISQANTAYWNKVESYRTACLNADGIPATPFRFTYVKGVGEGYICVKQDSLIKIEEK